MLHPTARLVDAATGVTLTGATLRARVDEAATGYLRAPSGLVMARTPISVDAAVRYLGAMAVGRPIALLDPALPATTMHDLVRRYEPAVLLGGTEAPCGYRPADLPALGPAWCPERPSEVVPHPDLGLLLATSGSTGSPKLVRLAHAAVLANARSIAAALGIDGGEVAPTSLPLFYSYGLSVLNSHLVAGATVVFEAGGIVSRTFWATVADHGVTSLAAVPAQYEMLRRLRFDPARHPSLRTLTQAGGRLRPELLTDFAARMESVGGRLHVMYGQTEATARMTALPPERLAGKPGSVGPAIPGGRLSIRDGDGEATASPQTVGEVVYQGPSVMMGYAERAEDLARGDDLGGTLATGDLGHLDDEGFLYLTGRLKRIGKVFGTRLNLDDVERLARGLGSVAAVGADDRVIVWAERATAEICRRAAPALAEELRLHNTGIEVRGIDRLPLLANGKVDYRALEARS
ncbi:AMP-binding protein [Actinomadura rudentiformis]|uniref:AMP-binding protein n=1 Tax=Actinomadura rudentiformis TaxID=359158 RepID=A0A6H9Z1R0_9ACTN|nr:AMP-binding protein [Actinomadura rudentiformis]